MKQMITLTLEPLDIQIPVEVGTPLREVLFEYGVEFPCGGRGSCKGCRIKVLEGTLAPTVEEQQILTAEELAQGWRLACRAVATEDVTLELLQWKAQILTDETEFEFSPRSGLGIVVDLGTTTMVAQLLDLSNASVIAVETEINPQARYGADLMSRVAFAIEDGGQQLLQKLVHQQIGRLIDNLFASTALSESHRNTPVQDVVVVGNTVMHHLFCGIDISPLSYYPFETENDGLVLFQANDLDWSIPGNPVVRFLPCLGGFVGSDILAGVIASRIYDRRELQAIIDLGTNGEIVVGNCERMVCASTAAGPAFEGARISMGMRAATGAIYQVLQQHNNMVCSVLGDGEPRGICGSGLVDAVAAGLELGMLSSSGRLGNGSETMPVCGKVSLNQNDIRQLQLAKGAIAAGFKILLKRWGANISDLTRVYLAGAFGNYINRESAARIGLFDVPLEIIHPAGNTALLGAKVALFEKDLGNYVFGHIIGRMEHVSLSNDPEFQDVYVEEMLFP